MTPADAAPVLVVEDKDSLRRLLVRALEQGGFETAAAADVGSAHTLLRTRPYSFVLTDLRLPDGDGLEVLRSARREQPEVPVAVLTAYGSVQAAVEAMKGGAVDFLEKPIDLEDLLTLVRSQVLRSELPGGAALSLAGTVEIVGRHPRLLAPIRLLKKVAPTESTVLLLGESGTGKELFARAIHGLSPRAAGPFVALNCAAIPETLMENELFGHERGAFTGASQRQTGRFEQASGGTLLLDEIGELDLGVQAKVLRVLEERCFQRIGGEREQQADVRLVAATNRDLERQVDAGRFRADLYYRLEVFPIELPPLRDRASDIPALALHLLHLAAERSGQPAPTLSDGALELLSGMPWPGNVRQLANVLERAVILCESQTLDVDELSSIIEPLVGSEERDETQAEEQRVRDALLDASGDKHRAAELLGVSYRTLQRRIKAFDLEGFPLYRD